MTELKWTSTQFRQSLSFVHTASRQHIIGLRTVRPCYGLRGIYGWFDSKIRFERKKTIRRSLIFNYIVYKFAENNEYLSFDFFCGDRHWTSFIVLFRHETL